MYNTLIEKRNYKGYSLEIHYDTDPFEPDWGMDIVKCFHIHTRYNLMGQPASMVSDYTLSPDDECRQIAGPDGLVLPLYMYEHGLIVLSLGAFSCPWDSGQVGIVYMHGDDIRENWNGDKEAARKYIEGVLLAWNCYYAGRVYGFIARSPEGEVIDSCWGYYGDEDGFEDLYDEMQGMADYEIEQQERYHNMC